MGSPTYPYELTNVQFSKAENEAIKFGGGKDNYKVFKNIPLNKEHFGAAFASIQVEEINTLVDLSASEIIVKGVHKRRVFPYIYSIALVLTTCFIIWLMYGVITEVHDCVNI